MNLDPKFVINLRGKEYPLYAGVLSLATDAGLKELSTKIVQIPTKENGELAVVEALAVFEDGRTFADVGDASPLSTKIPGAYLRIASTRAKGRALRDAMNIGQVLAEEVEDLEETPAPRPSAPLAPPAARPAPAPRPSATPESAGNGGETKRARLWKVWTTLYQEAKAEGLKPPVMSLQRSTDAELDQAIREWQTLVLDARAKQEVAR
jgi:hypothetical protein